MIITMAPSCRSGSALHLTCWMLLLAVLAASWQSTAQASRSLTAFQQTNFSTFSSERPQVIRAELLHRDHPDSPLAPPEGTTLAARWAAAVKRSDIRRRLIASDRRRLADFQTPIDLKGGLGGEYVMSISFGTPPQKFTGLVDTGSELVWVQCVPCTGCPLPFPQPDPLYDPSLSSSEINISCSDPICRNFPSAPCSVANNNVCRVQYAYLDKSSIEGTLTTESITLSNTSGANPNLPGFLMGCMNNNTGIFNNYDGIIGFDRGTYSFPSQMSGMAYLPVFSYCLVSFAATTTNTSTMLFGSSDPTIAPGLVYTPILDYGKHYYVNMTGISVNGVALNIPASLFVYDSATLKGGVIFDSGTTFTQFNPPIIDPLRQAVAGLVTYPTVTNSDTLCFDITGVTTPVYPQVTFHFGAVDGSVVDFNLTDDNAFGPYTGDTGVSCLTILSDPGDMIIGSVQQANHYIETDNTVNNHMGWITKDCTV